MKSYRKAIVSVILAAAVITGTAALSGCGNGDKDKAATTVPSTTKAAATTAAKSTAANSNAGNAESSDAQSENSQADGNAESSDSNNSVDNNAGNNGNYIDRADAVAAVKAQAGSGAQILDVQQGYTPDGIEAWVITVAPVTNSDENKTVTYYSGYQFCYSNESSIEVSKAESSASSSADDSNYIDRADAVAAVKAQAGSGAEILDVQQGYTPDGIEAWVITVAPVSNSDENKTVTYYSGYQFCYAE
ncbi:MAG: hypothetical protein U0L58_03215 [Ruminococcus sp.]|nr:hypothetical protein [Ruminococcus sp.]